MTGPFEARNSEEASAFYITGFLSRDDNNNDNTNDKTLITVEKSTRTV